MVAELESGRTLGDVTRGEACEIFKANLGDITQRIDSGYPLLVVPCLFFGNSLYLEFPGLTVIGSGFQRNDAAARARTESLARRLKTVADPTRFGPSALPGRDPEHGGRAGHVLRAGPTDDQHAREVAPRVGPGAIGAQGGAHALSADPGAVASLVEDLRGVVADSTGTTPVSA